MAKKRTAASQDRLNKLQVNIAAQIGKVRKQSGKTAYELADAVQLSPNYITMMERGVRTPTITTLHDIAEVLGAKVEVKITEK